MTGFQKRLDTIAHLRAWKD